MKMASLLCAGAVLIGVAGCSDAAAPGGNPSGATYTLQYAPMIGTPVSGTVSSSSDPLQPLVGTWRLTSMTIQGLKTKEQREYFGPAGAKGFLIVEPNGRAISFCTAARRHAVKSDEDKIAAYDSMFALTSRWRVTGNRIFGMSDVAYNEGLVSTPKLYTFTIAGDTLILITSPFMYPAMNQQVQVVSAYSRED